MTFSLVTLFIGSTAYLLLLFLVAYATEREWLPPRLVRHPAVYVLSLGVYATTWSYYGSVGFADRLGLNFITIYLGVSIAFILTPFLLLPLLRLPRTHQLTSVAPVFAFRFDSQLAGVLVSLMMLTGSLPYIALQIRAVAESTQVLSGDASPVPIALGFCAIVTGFAIVFGARHVTAREKHTGLVAAIAFESLVKIVALVTVAVVAVSMAFGSPAGMEAWLAANPERLEAFYAPVSDASWGSLLFLAFAAAFLLPRQFHMIFIENLRPSAMLTASWGFPLFLLILAAAVPPILWAGQARDLPIAPDYYVLGVAMVSESPTLALAAYLGGISAASAMIIVSTLALSSMSLNHLLLPLVQLDPRHDLYRALRWARRMLIAAIIGAGYLFYLILERSEGLVSWGLISFIAMAQFVPGIVGVLFWPRATRAGLIAGLTVGGTIWGLTVLLPALTTGSPVEVMGVTITQGVEHFGRITFWSVSLNALAFALFSLVTRPTEREREAAAACRDVSTSIPHGDLLVDSPAQFIEQLAPVTGADAARVEVNKALADLGLEAEESRPDRLQQLREQIERNLSGMMGPVLARMIVDERLRLDVDTHSALAQDVRLIEERLERSRSRFQGLAAEPDQLRRYHRQILEDLPLGIIAVTPNRRIVRWNPAMKNLTGITPVRAIGRQVGELEPPWGAFLQEFLDETGNHAHKRALALAVEQRWLSLHKATIAEPGRGETGDRLLLVEDVTELQRLEDELTHSERLASIGRLAAGVAHEIGNPITGITCLAREIREQSNGEPSAGADQILQQTERVNTIVQTLISYAHAGEREDRRPGAVPVAETVDEAIRVVRLSKRARDVTFRNEVKPGVRVTADPQRLVQVFVNLFTNAVDASAPDAAVMIVARVGRRTAQIRVIDDGPGIPAAIQDKILEPFFTTKDAGRGTGLGLSLVYNIIREFDGDLRIRNRGGRRSGTEVLLTLPVASRGTGDQGRRYA